MAKLDEFKSYLDNGALRLADKRKLSRDVNFLTGRWVLTVKVDKNGYFSKFKARWVCRGFQDKHAWEQQTDSPTATRYGFRLVAQCAANNFWGLFHSPQRAGTGAGAVVAALQDSLEAEAAAPVSLALALALAGRRPGTDTEAAGD